MKNLQRGSAVVAIIVLVGAGLLAGFGVGQVNKAHQLAEKERELELLETYNSLGAFRPSNYVGKLLTRLDEGGSETTFNTTPGTAADGSSLTTAKIGDFVVFTINPGANNEEKISASAVSVSGTTATWTIINRGLSFTENVAVTANKKQHAIGETVIISNDDHYLDVQYGAIDEDVALIGSWTAPEPTGSSGLATKNYVDTNVNGGAVSIDAVVPKAVAGETVAAGDLVYFDDTDNEWKLTDADTASTVYNVELGIAQGAGTDGAAISGGVLTFGLDANQSGLTKGDVLYVSNTAGAIATSAGTNSRIIGRAYDADEIYFVPSAEDYGIRVLDVTYTGDNTFSGVNTFSGTTTFSGLATFTGGVSSTKPVVNIYTASSTWTKPSNLQYIEVYLCGAGGGAGNGDEDGTGGGGGAGGFSYELLDSGELSATSSVAVTIGAGGSGGAANGANNGTSGGTTSFSTFLSATGGSGGNGSQSATGDAGAAGTGSNGDLNLSGQPGQIGSGATTNYISGAGGDSEFGYGGVPVETDSPGNNGTGYCSGGSGGVDDDSTGQVGGDGTNGLVIVKEYY